jgi:hypothetical protein
MEHNYVRNDNFNILTMKYDKKGFFTLTGETKDPLEVGDTVNYLVNEQFDVLGVTKVLERRDSRDFPKGNGLFYKINCGVVANPNPPQKEEPKETVKKL